ncbi:MAG: CCA tRNA nucleotidyltransferase [Deltaproteobacteria bacterium]|nr:MAG: CCA tRNA nucleotidyltransferase [Deltaproteobacteria bacterium]
MRVPKPIPELARAVDDAGGRALLVGGGVRDELLGKKPKDHDLEVYGLEVDALIDVLRRFGRVDEVGRSFGVLKLTPRGGAEIDVAIPRRDSNAGPGHRGIAVEGDPHMSIEEAARRRDLTVNALLYDPLTDELIDPHGGLADLRAQRLRAVDADTFLEDPLRALRAVQFAARLGFTPDPSLVVLCREASLDELPAERIFGEWAKLLIKGTRPSLGMTLARDAAIGRRVFPDRVDDPALDEALDRLAAWPHRDRSSGWRLAAGLLVWLAATPDPEPTLERLGVHRYEGFALRREVLRAHAAAEAPATTATDLRRLSDRSQVLLGLALRHARGEDVDGALALAAALGVLRDPPPPLLRGADLRALGMPAGPAMGLLLREVYEAQLDGTITDADEAAAMARAKLA